MTRSRTPLHVPLVIATLIACSKGEHAAAGDSVAAQSPAAAPGAAAAAPQGGPITQAEVRNYRLTLENVRAMHRAEMEWARTAKPAESGDDDGSDAGDIENDATTTSGANEMLRKMQQDPAVMDAIRKTGQDPRKVAIHTMVAAMSSMFAAANSSDLPPDIAPENVAFAKANMAELQRMQKEREALMDSVKAARGGR